MKHITTLIAMVLVIIAFLVAIIIELQPITKTLTIPEATPFANVPHVSENNITSTPKPTPTASPTTSQPVPSISEIPRDTDCFAKITISTDKKTRTYEVMPNVDEQTLKHYVGWLPSSSMPYEDGMCILMGHRDTDFKILKNCDIGDKITLSMNNSTYTYTISFIDILDSNDALRFLTNPNYSLVLVTCYPFYYSGHAPKKILFYCIAE